MDFRSLDTLGNLNHRRPTLRAKKNPVTCSSREIPPGGVYHSHTTYIRGPKIGWKRCVDLGRWRARWFNGQRVSRAHKKGVESICLRFRRRPIIHQTWCGRRAAAEFLRAYTKANPPKLSPFEIGWKPGFVRIFAIEEFWRPLLICCSLCLTVFVAFDTSRYKLK